MIRFSVLATGALLLATGAFAGCGFDAATDRPYTPAAGVDNRTSTVDVLSAMIVAKRPGAGTFIAGLSNGSSTKTIAFESLDPVNAVGGISADTFTPYSLAPMGYINLSSAGGVPVTGAFTAGDFVQVIVGFDDGESSTLDIPVVTECDQYAGLDLSTPSATTTPTTTASPTEGASSETLPPGPPPPFLCDDPGGTDSPSSSDTPSATDSGSAVISPSTAPSE